ncbi:hypothetical protein HU200_062230 [Digitaria exilis]|uniref:F-box domain-containing protein n=1 Tax=Digitaria exilis TaxID=1010633 RepID=A0A835A625_9POAL|nr:hypothetical protein HU200_062230 [Digitaria exilis]
MAPKAKCRGRKGKARTLPPPPAARPPPLPPPAARLVTVADLTEELLRAILRRLAPADLLRAALACHRWRQAASRVALKRAPPLLGYFFHPQNPAMPPPSPEPSDKTRHPAVFAPLDADDSPRLSLDLAPTAARGLSIQDVHLGLVLLLHSPRPKSMLPRILAIDPASRRRVLLSPPPRGALPGDRWRGTRSVIGVAVLSRAHPSRLSFDAVCLTIDGDLPRAWVVSVCDGGDCAWRALPRAEGVVVNFDPWWFEARSVHAAGNIYWHICNSSRLLQLDPRTLDISFMPVPAVLGDRWQKYRIGEDPAEDGRLCMAAIVDEVLQIWVRQEGRWSDRGWFMERETCMTKVLDTIPKLPKDTNWRMVCTWLSDIDYARTGKVFIKTWGYGRYSFHTETGKLERLMMTDGKEFGDPMFAYTLAWPPEFLTPRD